jgi:hypothetical protein
MCIFTYTLLISSIIPVHLACCSHISVLYKSFIQQENATKLSVDQIGVWKHSIYKNKIT